MAADAALHASEPGLAATLLVVVFGAALLASGRVGGARAVALLGVSAVLAACFTLRRSPWLVIPDAITAALLLGAAAGLRGAGSVLDLPLTEALARAIRVVGNLAAGPWFAVCSAIPHVRGLARGDRRDLTMAILRGLAPAILVVAVLSAMLARADPIFRSFFEPHGNMRDLAVHLPGLVAGPGSLLSTWPWPWRSRGSGGDGTGSWPRWLAPG